MAEVTLRAYIKDIDNLIERDQLDEAIAHCRHILQVYPKHLETYRLLGKAYLEAKRFGDAADIFQRVLSAIPEDFVSHIGMAIVREDEGNLDAAIWHMERAFETNPANPAIRQELSRLIGRRDGLEPHKIRLTRGALARQYAKGELYPQAIAELRSALQEDPDRPDLEILLAKMYWQSDQFDTAKTLSKQILEKLPFSYEANRILAAIYQATNNPEKASEYHRRLAALNPYLAFVDSAATDPSSVSATAVSLNRSDWLPGQPLPTTDAAEPGWVTSLGVDLSDDDALPVMDSVPSWMSELEGDARDRQTGPLAFVPADADDALSEEADIPEWMREAGWEPSTGEFEETPVQFSDDELESLDAGGPMPIPEEERGEEEEIAPADIPDWLQDIAPSEMPLEPESDMEMDDTSEGKREFVPDWLADISSEADDVPPEPVEDTQEVRAAKPEKPEPAQAVVESDGQDQPEVPTWVEDQAPGATSTIISWLGDRPGVDTKEDEDAVADQPTEMAETPARAGDDTEIPSWLEGLGEEEAEESPLIDEGEADEEAPSWLAGVAGAASDVDIGFEAAAPDEDIELEPASIDTEPEAPVAEDAWLRGLAESEIEDQETSSTARAPDWLAEEDMEQAEAEEPSEVPDWLQGIGETPEGELSPGEDEDAPEWLSGIGLEDRAASPTPQAPRQDVPEWLQGIAEHSTAEEDLSLESAQAGIESSEDAPPSWLQDFSEGSSEAQPEFADDDLDLQALRQFEEEISAEPDGEPLVGSPRTPEEIDVGEDLDDEEVYQWLESLAQEQEIETDQRGLRSEIETREEAVAPMIDESIPPEEPEASLDWLEDLASERGLDMDVTPQTDASQLPTPEPEPPVVEPEQEEEAPDWLREMASSATDETVITPRSAEFADEVEEPEEQEIPGWLDEATSIAADVPAEPAEADVQAAPSELEPALPKQPIESARSAVQEPEPEPREPVQQQAPEPTADKPAEVMIEAKVSSELPEPPEVSQVIPEVSEEPVPAEPEQETLAEAPVEAESGITEGKVEQLETPEPETKREAAPEPEPEPKKKASKFKEPMTEPTQLLKSARQALGAGDAGRALSDYRKLIDRKQDLETVIKDLQRAAERYPNLPKVWQTLGDAYMKADQLPEAIKSYKRGMEVA